MRFQKKINTYAGALWSRRFTIAAGGSFLTLMAFDVLWCMSTNFRPMGFTSTYLFAAALAMLMALPAICTRRRLIQLLVLLVFDILLEANLMYCRTYFEAIPPASYLLGGNVAQFGDSIRASLRWGDLLLPLIAAATWLLMGKPTRVQTKESEKSNPWPAYVVTLSVLSVACAVTATSHGGVAKHISDCKNECYYHAAPPVLYTLPVSFATDLAETVKPVGKEEINFARDIIKQRRQLAVTEAARESFPAKDNLVFLFVESFEAWPIGKRIEGQEITPVINRWLADSVAWININVESQVGTGRSIDGQLLMSTGLYPTTNYVYSMRYADSTFPSLAKELKRARGTHSYLLSGDRANTWNQSVVAASFGIETPRYRDSWDCSEYFGKPHNPTDKSLFRQIEERMRSGEIWPEGEKALVEIVTYSSHLPFRISPEAKTIRLTAEYPAKLKEYIEAVNYADSALGQLVDYLRTRSDWERTLVVIVGDHEGLSTDRATILDADDKWRKLVDAGQKIPMIVINGPVRGLSGIHLNQADVYSTTLDLMGIRPEWPGLGFSAFTPLDSASRAPVVAGQHRAGNAIIAADLLRTL